jgi:excisionase family DNA binding protein
MKQERKNMIDIKTTCNEVVTKIALGLTLPVESLDWITELIITRIKPLIDTRGKEPDNNILDVEGLADYLKVNKSWVYDQVKNSAIPYVKAGKFLRFRKSAIDKWIEMQTVRPLPSYNSRNK